MKTLKSIGLWYLKLMGIIIVAKLTAFAGASMADNAYGEHYYRLGPEIYNAVFLASFLVMVSIWGWLGWKKRQAARVPINPVALVVALTLVGVLTASSAWACTWVLWTMGHDSQGETWGVVAAYSPAKGGEQACWTERQRTEQIYKQKGLDRQYTHTCLPDTVDPRGPKGK